MAETKKIWPATEAAAHFRELLALAANGDIQQVTDEQGRTFTVQLSPLAAPHPNGLSVYEEALRGDDWQPERLTGTLRDVDL